MARHACLTRSKAAQETSNFDLESRLVELLRGVKRGEDAAFTELFEAVHKRVLRHALFLVGDPNAAEEVAADVFRQIWAKAGGFDPSRASAYSWILMLTRSRAIDLIRRRRRLQDRQSEGVEVAAFCCPREGVEQRLLRVCRERRVTGLLAGLQPSQRSLLQLAFYEDKTHQEIAQLTGLPLGTVKTRIRCALRKMRVHLEEASQTARC